MCKRRPRFVPRDHSPLEGESQKPSRQAKADAVGGVNSPPPGSRPRQPIAHDRRLRGRIAKIQGNGKKSPRFRRVANRTHSNPPPRTGSRQPRSLATPPPCRADHSRKNSRSLMKTNHQWTRINTNRPEDRWTCFNHKRHQNSLLQFGALGVTMSWDDGFLGARASRPHKAWHSPTRISHQVAECIVKRGCRLQYLDWRYLRGLQLQTALGAPWLVLFPSARTCSLERSPRKYALRCEHALRGAITAP